MNNDRDKVKEILESEEVPEKLNPENISKMLDEKAPKKKRSGISVFGRITAMTAACALIVGTTVHTVNNYSFVKKNCFKENSVADNNNDISSSSTTSTNVETVTLENVAAPYMSGAKDYEQIYKLIKKAEKQHTIYKNIITGGSVNFEAAVDEAVNEDVAPAEFDDRATQSNEAGYDYNKAEEKPATEFTPPITEPTTIPESTETTTEVVTTEETTETVTTAESTETESTTESAETTTTTTENDEDEDYSDTYNQEAGVLEADIVKTDGKKIYYLTNKTIYGGYNDDGVYVNYTKNSNVPVINIASVDKGNFTDSIQISVAPETYLEDGWESIISVNDMYLYNDMIAVIGNVNSSCQIFDYDEKYYDDEWKSWYTPYHYEDDNKCFVSFYTKDAELIGTYWQDGDYSDVRISPDGYMYLTSTYYSCSFSEIEDADDIERYIPKCGVDDDVECMPAGDILLPKKKLDNSMNLSYTIIGSIDLTVSEQFTPVDSKALADYTGNLYSSADNIYVTFGYEDTNITRISVSGGNIVPMASGKVEGSVKDQFSMSEYDGYFRIATTVSKWVNHGNFITDALGVPTESEFIRDNRVYVLDMDLNTIGLVSGFGENETIKSVNFSGNMGYVVTYRQTDPLFAIDLSNPAEPFITDEYKINGYSTYMQNWTDGLLLGFGVDADENGIENGVKLVMFDNSDPYNLKEVGLYSINNQNDDEVYIHSPAVWERKQLLIAPEKNLIGVPVTIYENIYDHDRIEYVFFSYENGEFIRKGAVSKDLIHDYNTSTSYFDRAVYIGDYVYILSADKFVSADIETITVTDEINFD
ncbi:MAG: beta-propeller domain-containing protein [Ruminococcus sp.]|nr:beta-propeller domain-containing protein [Ruminococcus sp.]